MCIRDSVCTMQEVVSALISIGLAVRNLSLASNDVGDAGARALARLLEDKPPAYRCGLTSLNLRGNSIGSAGCQVCSLALLIVVLPSF